MRTKITVSTKIKDKNETIENTKIKMKTPYKFIYIYGQKVIFCPIKIHPLFHITVVPGRAYEETRVKISHIIRVQKKLKWEDIIE